jgi:hypothetical protein
MAIMQRLKCAVVTSLLVGLAFTHVGAMGEDKPAAEQASDTAKSPVAAVAKEEEEFKPPHGFVTKKRGDKVLYCIRDSTVGTRFKTEKCYDKAQMKDYVLAREQNNRDFDQRRAICSNPAVCSP